MSDNSGGPAGAPVTKSGTFGERWKTLAAWAWQNGASWLETDPPKREYLLSLREEEGPPRGVVPLGKVGMLAAGGGAGKTFGLCDLALAVATGRRWFDTYSVETRGDVLLAMAEEDRDEMRRRLYYAAEAMQLSPDERREAEQRIVALPLAGVAVELTKGQKDLARPGKTAKGAIEYETDACRELHRRLESDGREWRLVILDPMSRFAGPDVEVDNHAATRFVEALERLTTVAGNPTVFFSHHTTKMSRLGATNASAARGSSGISDGVRFQISLEPFADPRHPLLTYHGLVTLRFVKNSYGFYPPELDLARDDKQHGALRPATKEDRALYEALKDTGSNSGKKTTKGRRQKPDPDGWSEPEGPPDDGPDPDFDPADLPF